MAWITANNRNAFRAEHIIVNAHDELIITTANRGLTRLC
jgi:hypothetical protein